MESSHYPSMILLVLVIVGVSAITGTVSSAGTESLVSTGPHTANQDTPSTWGDYIVWTDWSGDVAQIRLLNVTSGELQTISDPSAGGWSPRIQGTSVVWLQSNTGGSDVYHYDIPTGITTQVTDYPAEKWYPVVYGRKIVWMELEAVDEWSGNTYYDLQMTDLDNPGQVINITPHVSIDGPGYDDSSHSYPSIWGDYVVWEDWDDYRYTLEIFMNDTATGTLTQISDDLGYGLKMRPAISGNTIVWADDRNGDFDIFSDSVSPGEDTDLTPYSGSAQFLPAIDGDTFIWLDDRDHVGSYFQIGMDSLSSPADVYPLTPDGRLPGSTDQPAPSVFGNRVVWSDVRSPGYSEIYMYTDGVEVTCPVASFTLDVSSGSPPLTVQFTDTSAPVPSYWIWDFGDGEVSTLQNPLHTYPDAGTYPVTLTAGTTYCRNATVMATAHNISVGASPVVGFTASPLEGMAPLEVTFTESSSGSPDSWNWSFGDNTFSNEQNPTHTYTTGGVYTVRCNATNAYGTGTLTRNSYITVTSGAHEIAFTNITGISVQRSGTDQYLSYDQSLLPDYTLEPSGSFLIAHPPLSYGWQNITFLSGDNASFTSNAGFITGKLASTNLTTKDILPVGFSSLIGSNLRLNYQITMDDYRTPGWLITDVWEGTTPLDEDKFVTVAVRSNFAYMSIPYTVNTTRHNLGNLSHAKINMSVGTGWLTGTEGIDWGRQHIYVMAIGYNSSGSLKGMVLPVRSTVIDAANNLEYFEAEIPRQYTYLNKYALALLSGSGNPFQLITLTVTEHVPPYEPPQPVNPPSDSDSGDTPSGGGAGAVAAAATVPVIAPTATSTPVPTATADPGTSAKIYTNGGGVVTQATLLRSTDGRATITVSEGVVAKDASGNPLSQLTIRALPPGSLPPLPSGSVVTFAGLAYDIGPDGATFSPPVTISFTLPQAQWGQDYSVKLYDQKSGIWQDLPTVFDPATGTVTAQFSHLSVLALFSGPRAPSGTPTINPAATTVPPVTPEVTAQPPSTAVGIFSSMMAWAADMVANNIVLIVVIIIIIGIVLYLVRKPKFPGSGQ